MRKLMFWFLAAILFQVSIYEYLDQVILAPAARFSQQAVGGVVKSGAPSLFSYDNAYYAQVTAQRIKIFSSKDNRLVKEISSNSKESFTYFSWLPERNLALVGISLDDFKGSSVTLESVNPENNSVAVTPKVVGLAKGAKIVSVAFSTQTNVTYMLVRNGNEAAIYRTDADNTLKKVNAGTSSIKRIATLKNQDILLYDNTEKGKVYDIDGNGRRIELSPVDGKYALIGVDKEDNIYIGRLNTHELITTILVGKVHGGFKEFKKLDSSYPIDSISVTYDGRVLFR